MREIGAHFRLAESGLPEPSPEIVRQALQRVLSDFRFLRAGSLARFLLHTVEAALSGRSQELKEYAVGVKVFRRGAEFDPRIDPIVRVQARKLRAALADYYQNEGRHESVVIHLPRGAYVPAFAAGTGFPPESAIATLAVLPLAGFGRGGRTYSDGLTEELIATLMRQPGVLVAARSSVFQYTNRAVDIRRMGILLNVKFVLEGSVRACSGQIRVSARLIDVATGFQCWAETYDRGSGDPFRTQSDLSAEIAMRLRPLLFDRRQASKTEVNSGRLP